MKVVKKCLLVFVILVTTTSFSQKLKLSAPNNKIKVALWNQDQIDVGKWYLELNYVNNSEHKKAIPRIDLGLIRSDQDFSKDLRFVKAGRVKQINEEYTAVHGKRLQRKNSANEVVVSFERPDKSKMNIILRAYNDGLVFRYEFPEEDKSTFLIEKEMTSYTIPENAKRWLQKFNPANEGYYRVMNDATEQGDWAYPALFQSPDSTNFYLIHEADLNRSYAGTKLANLEDPSEYKLTFPDASNGRGKGESKPTINLPWKSPWRVVMIGSLDDIVASTLVDDVSEPSILENTEWINPGLVSWNYWSNNHGTRDYQVVRRFTDLAAAMNWPYTLLDWEWDKMGNGGDLEDAIEYVHSKGVKPLIWYNSGGDHTYVEATPKDRMLTHANRMEEFAKLQKMGIAGVKIDFFESEKQDMINYYLDILEDAAEYEMLVYFHGSLVPRGWGRTYPHLMTYEGVRGAEWYNNVPDFTYEAPVHNTILPFTRNVVGAMDYTPVTFTNSQYPHITSYGHELALGVLFESALQHMADRPEGYYSLPAEVLNFLRDLPATWDDIRLLDGYPGEEIIMARRKGESWYIAGINGEEKEKSQTLSFDFLPKDQKYRLSLHKDGSHDQELLTSYHVVDGTISLEVKMLRRGGFAGSLTPITN